MRFKKFLDYIFGNYNCRRKIRNVLDDVVEVIEYYKRPYDFSKEIALPLATCFPKQKSPLEDLFFKPQVGFPRTRITPMFFLKKERETGYELLEIRTIGDVYIDKPKIQNFAGVLNSLKKFDRFKSLFPTEGKVVSFYLLIGIYSFFNGNYFNQAGKEIRERINERWSENPFELVGEYDIAPSEEIRKIAPYFFKFLLYKSEEEY